jgi:hypothetical protein
MSWADQVERAHAAFLAAWGIAALWQAQDQSASATITGVIKNPGMHEEYVPGGSTGTSVVRFWVDMNSLNPQPIAGDGITLNGVTYDIGDIDVDIEGGAVLKLRRNA